MTSNCQIVLTLAHLLRQHSLSYDTEKKSLLDTSVRCATQLGGGGEVHIILTGSPRPTFAETNAWLLEGKMSTATASTSPKRSRSSKVGSIISGVNTANTNTANDILTDDAPETASIMNEVENNDRPTHLKGSYSIADNVHYSTSNIMDIDNNNNNNGSDDEDEDMQQQDDGQISSQLLLQEYIHEFTTNNSSTTPNANNIMGREGDTSGGKKGGRSSVSHNNSFIRRNTTGVTTTTTTNDSNSNNKDGTIRRRSTIDTSETLLSAKNNIGPMVGQAVVNAISQSSGVGLQSSRSKLLQGTIDRPLWSQNRWTDGECLFSELVELCGMESFEMMGSSSAAATSAATGLQQQGPDVAAGAAVVASTPPKTTKTTTNMSANLITVPATTLRDPEAGISPTTMDEIARGILRTVKRKKSPPASKVYIVLPGPDQGIDDEKRMVVVTLLKQAWMKLEQYNHMIGQPNLMSDAELEFVNVS
ncbi:hypothetical protein ACHAXM_001313 [Skeletonema potamos]